MEIYRRVVKTGNSLMVSIPKEVVEASGLQAGDLIKLTFEIVQKAFKAPSPAPATGPAGDNAA